MRKIIVLSFITLDGVMQAPGGPGEDDSGGFKYGGWTVGYFDDFMGKVMTEQMGHPFDLLLGRKTYDIFAAYWPRMSDADPGARVIIGPGNTSSHIGRSTWIGKRRSQSMAMSPRRSPNSRKRMARRSRFTAAAT